ncbi:P-loop containing nucleoside triphosphate hydrolase protein [Rhizophagus diaphanus]|nr:P-loop containing nucleoside triphosphate hydrolase protein [Rhizophagus diaphanus] [Rhizophagus sp. MUCL 43196]
MEFSDKIRIVVVGDPGVGKTSLVHILCHNEVLRHPSYTIGCTADVKIHSHTRTHKSYFVEFIDVGGSSKHKSSRNMFYHQINGIILVHDVSNRRSYYNLWNWVSEIIESEGYKEFEKSSNSSGMSGSHASMNWNSSGSGNWNTVSGSLSGSWMSGSNTLNNSISGNMNGLSSSTYNGHKKNEEFKLSLNERSLNIPILVAGTKADLVKHELTGRQRRYSIIDEFGGDYVNLCAMAPTQFTPNSIAIEKINSFFDKVIDKKYGITSEHLQSPTLGTFAASSSTSLSTGGIITNREERRRGLSNILISGSNSSNNSVINGLPSPGLNSVNSNRLGGVGIIKDLSPRKQGWNVFRNPATYSNQPIINDDHKLLRHSSSKDNINLLRTYNSSSNLRDTSLSSSPLSSNSLLRSNSTSNLRENMGNVGSSKYNFSSSLGGFKKDNE